MLFLCALCVAAKGILLQRDKGKRKNGWESVGLYEVREKNLRLGLREILSLTMQLSSDWGWLPVHATGKERNQPWVQW